MGTDKKETWRNSLLQHGKENDRIYLMRLDPSDSTEIIPHLDGLAADKGYGKIFAKVPEECGDTFKAAGYKEEAYVPRFYNGREGAFFLGKFFNDNRVIDLNAAETQKVIEAAEDLKKDPLKADRSAEGAVIRRARPEEAGEISAVYREVFESYPFPIHDTEYILMTMNGSVRYYVAFIGGNIAGVSSSEMNADDGNTEMTDFATLPAYRGKHIATSLLKFMDEDMKVQGFFTAYTIARSVSYGMNRAFAANGYEFAGTLLNNTCIAGGIENMNVWYKHL